MWEVRRYNGADCGVWNRFVEASRQGTFLFKRDYMDYHRDRFIDHSLMIFHRRRLVALLPGNAVDDVFWSHRGLTYGGLLTLESIKTADVYDIFKSINNYLASQGFHKVVYKAVPWIYHRIPSEEDLYALSNVCGARLICRHVSSTLSANRLPFTESRKSGLRKARRNGISVVESNDFDTFWQILSNNLERQFDARPVHSADELKLLHGRFPQFIRLFMCYKDDLPIAGTIVYETSQVVHTQYISASPEGKDCGALDLLFDHLLNERYAGVPHFDFGKSSDGDGHDLNRGLIFQKEGFGGRAVCYDWYEYDL